MNIEDLTMDDLDRMIDEFERDLGEYPLFGPKWRIFGGDAFWEEFHENMKRHHAPSNLIVVDVGNVFEEEKAKYPQFVDEEE